MTKFKIATINYREIEDAARDMFNLWKDGDPSAVRIAINAKSDTEAFGVFYAVATDCAKGEVYMNDKYQVIKRDTGNGTCHLSIKTIGRTAEHDWREYQQIKNELVGTECEALELYPAESRKVDSANQFHLWCFTDPTIRIPVGWKERMVSNDTVGKSQQRQMEG